MINRTFRVVGAAYLPGPGKVEVEASLGGEIVYSGPVKTIPEEFPIFHGFYSNNVENELFEFTKDIDLTGELPFSLKVTNGSLFFQQVIANYSGGKIQEIFENDTPVTVLVQPQDFYRLISNISAEDDGRRNIKIDNVTKLRNNDHNGPWNWVVHHNQTFTCDLFIDPSLIVTHIPTFQELTEMPRDEAIALASKFVVMNTNITNNFLVD
jgi:hypothetical protein